MARGVLGPSHRPLLVREAIQRLAIGGWSRNAVWERLPSTTSSTDPGHGRHFSTGLRRAASTKESVAKMAGEVSQVSPAPWIWPLLGVSRSDNMPPIAIFTFQKVKADPIALLEFFDLTRDSSAGSRRGSYAATWALISAAHAASSPTISRESAHRAPVR